jgi:hypothetical protein
LLWEIALESLPEADVEPRIVWDVLRELSGTGPWNSPTLPLVMEVLAKTCPGRSAFEFDRTSDTFRAKPISTSIGTA